MPQSRTPLIKALQTAFKKSLGSDEGPVNLAAGTELPHQSAYDRRRFILDALKTGTSIGIARWWWPSAAFAQIGHRAPVISIIGGGMAGLNAAYRLKKAGLRSIVYEAADSLGGRINTFRNLLGDGLTTEAGGEFIDSSHLDMLALASEFGLERYDTLASSETKLIRDDYFIKGNRYNERQIINEFRQIATRIKQDNASLPDENYGASPKARALDQLSIEEYLTKLGARGWFFDLLDAAFTSEFGLNISQQSSLNFITMIGTDTSKGKFEIFGESDERYKIKGGNDTLIRELARRLGNQIATDHKLHSLTRNGTAYTLNFGDKGDFKADYVIIAIPFSVLRHVDIRVELPPTKKLAIEQLGYGTNSKLVLGLNDRIWRRQGFSGYLLNDVIQNGWDNSQMQNGNRGTGGYTVFLGGDEGNKLREENRSTYLSALDAAYNGAIVQFNNRSKVFNWPSNPNTLGSYSCYKVGQWSTISGVEGEAVENLFFAGEHCSSDFQGYMNGAAESGRKAAHAIIRKEGSTRPQGAKRRARR
jgi:monoamine oxidase